MKTKPVILIVVTLILGFIIGMLTSAQLRFSKLKPVKTFFSVERFREGFYKTVQPDDQQKEEINAIIDKYARINNEIHARIRKDIDANFRAMRKELDATLTKEQLGRVREMDEHRQEMVKQYLKERRSDSMRKQFGKHVPDKKQFTQPPEKQESDTAVLFNGK